MKFFIYPNLSKANAAVCVEKIIKTLIFKDNEIYVDKRYKKELDFYYGLKFIGTDELDNSFDYAIALGGDGTILECAKAIMKYDLKLIGINTGRLGFMSSLESNEIDSLDKIGRGQFRISERMMLDGEISGRDSENEVCSLNDIVIYEKMSKMIEFEVFLGKNPVGKYHANGVIFSTPTGSTAYALSAGGPIISPEMKCIEMTLICPHSLFARPIIFSPDDILRVKLNLRDGHEVFLTADGESEIPLEVSNSVTIKKSDKSVSLINFGYNTFFDSLDKKFMHPIK